MNLFLPNNLGEIESQTIFVFEIKSLRKQENNLKKTGFLKSAGLLKGNENVRFKAKIIIFVKIFEFESV